MCCTKRGKFIAVASAVFGSIDKTEVHNVNAVYTEDALRLYVLIKIHICLKSGLDITK